jgi:holdfast attachment protein HfaA
MGPKGLTCVGALALAAAALSAAPAAAQSMNSYSSSFNAGWGRTSGDESRPVQLRNARDENGNRLFVDGVMQTGADQSSYSSSSTGGAFDGGSGAGFGGNTAIGNNLNVNVVGNWNTVIVNSTQINNGDVIAGGKRAVNTHGDDELNGGVDLND